MTNGGKIRNQRIKLPLLRDQNLKSDILRCQMSLASVCRSNIHLSGQNVGRICMTYFIVSEVVSSDLFA